MARDSVCLLLGDFTHVSIYVNPLNYGVPQKTVWGNLVALGSCQVWSLTHVR